MYHELFNQPGLLDTQLLFIINGNLANIFVLNYLSGFLISVS